MILNTSKPVFSKCGDFSLRENMTINWVLLPPKKCALNCGAQFSRRLNLFQFFNFYFLEILHFFSFISFFDKLIVFESKNSIKKKIFFLSEWLNESKVFLVSSLDDLSFRILKNVLNSNSTDALVIYQIFGPIRVSSTDKLNVLQR